MDVLFSIWINASFSHFEISFYLPTHTCQVASSEKRTLPNFLSARLPGAEYFSLKARFTLARLVSALVGGALAREMVATEVKEEDGGVGEGEGEGGGVVGFVDGVEGLVGCRELKESGQQKRSWK